MSNARLVIVSAPSGTGKTSLDTQVQKRHADRIEMVRSYTTRPKRRSGTVEKNYIYVTRDEFQQMCEAGKFVEWATVFGHLYGTARCEVDRILASDRIALLEIDVQGGQQIRAQFPDSSAIFILPPTVAELQRRLTQRGTDAAGEQQRRLRTAWEEVRNGRSYDYFIVNADFESSCAELENIIIHRRPPRLERSQGLAQCERLLREFQQLGWGMLQKLVERKFFVVKG